MKNKFDIEIDKVVKQMQKGIFSLSGYQGNSTGSFFGGENIKKLEKLVQNKFNVKHAICCNSATSGLFIALYAAIGFHHDCEVIVTPYSMTCSASIPLWFGHNPVFADIERDYFCIDPNDLEKKITSKTKAIIVVDLFGQPYNVSKINAIAAKHNLVVIEDAAQAIGAKYKNKYAGTLGDIGIYSLNVHKHINCGEGGIIVTNNDKLAHKVRLIMNHGEAVVNDMQIKKYSISGLENTLGLNLRMPELSAVIAIEQFKKLDRILESYRDNAKYFPVEIRKNCTHSFYRYAYTNEWLLSNITPLSKFNFKQGYITPIYQMPLFQAIGHQETQLKNVEWVNKNIILAWQKGCG